MTRREWILRLIVLLGLGFGIISMGSVWAEIIYDLVLGSP
jgi:hypothetical protein